MLFNSTIFLFFFLPTTLFLYFLAPNKFKNTLLLIASLIFYFFASVDFMLIILFSILINFTIAILIADSKNKKKLLIIGLIFNLGILFRYKYLIFFVDSILNPTRIFFGIHPLNLPTIVLPLALSFYTFHALSYLFDIYKATIKPTRNILNLALYFLFFPHLVAGPIVRFGEISEYLHKRTPTVLDFSHGTSRFIIGLAKKVLIADILGSVTDEIFAIPPQNMTWETAWLGIICFTLQIYFDFSGYSDMAIGIASMFGFKFPENFNYPYISGSIREYWTRWHMTLYRWLRDYIYYPLALKWAKGSKTKLTISLFITFILSGLWHGAGWHFIFWGALQAIFMTIERLKQDIFKDLLNQFKYLYVVLAIMVSNVFFRSESMGYAIEFLKRMFLNFTPPSPQFRSLDFLMNNERTFVIILGMILATPIIKVLEEKLTLYTSNFRFALYIHQSLRFSFLLLILSLSMIYVASQTYSPFLYFKF